ncbi:MAG: ABC transporter ATP-binding protein [Ruminococcus sp.]|uniref:ABC transporter ATP-binding protein n=1 Tax=Ruminococcus sp. TaxID=41978 RepID=UPI0025EC84A0|nr:ABC transporter ATP-binding protein [Ruminococcus sp.]MBO4866429.1 ABC transporter ATP-binding protein [Ruminococcus sp.]
MNIIAENISKSYIKKGRKIRQVTAVQTTSAEFESGKLTVIFGRSGSGKTTLLNILSGLIKPTSGRVKYESKDIFTLNDSELSKFRAENIGYIPQGQSSLGALTVLENLLLPAALIGRNIPDNEVEEILKTVGLAELKDAYPNELSGGELRRLAIARALVNKPSVIFADEPTNDLDDENTQIIFELLKKTAEQGTAVISVTHDTTAADFAHKIYRMDAGVLTKQEGIKREIA